MPGTTRKQVVRWFVQEKSLALRLETSRLQVTSVSARTYKCSYPGCSKTFKRKQNWKRHKKTVHNPPKYQCPFPGCDQTFKQKDGLSNHLKYIHNFDESKRLSCPHPNCDQTFKRNGDLNVHICYQHSDTPRLKCPYPDCNKTYQRNSGLNQHIRFAHLNIRQHICEKCGMGYRRIQDLRNHLERDLCGSSHSEDRMKFRKEHDNAVNQLKKFLKEVKNPKVFQSEAVLSNGTKVDLLVHCPDNRRVGFDVTIGRSDTNNLRNAILEKFPRGYEQFCDIVYIVVISGVKNTIRTIRNCDKSPLKPKKTRVVHWRAIIRDNPKYVRIFQQIEDEAVL